MPIALPSGFEVTVLGAELVHLRAPTPEHPTPMQCAALERELANEIGVRLRVPREWYPGTRPFVYVRRE